jgi:hypothetical protein
LAEYSSKERVVAGSDHARFRATETNKKYLAGATHLVNEIGKMDLAREHQK